MYLVFQLPQIKALFIQNLIYLLQRKNYIVANALKLTATLQLTLFSGSEASVMVRTQKRRRLDG